MPVTFACGGCGFKTKVKDELAGKKIKCPKCGVPGVIPAVMTKQEQSSSDDLLSVNLDKFQDVEPEEGEELNPALNPKAPAKKKKKKTKSKYAPVSSAVKGAAMGFSLLSVGVLALLVVFVLPDVIEGLNATGDAKPQNAPAPADPAAGGGN
jgi:hypothetical protein